MTPLHRRIPVTAALIGCVLLLSGCSSSSTTDAPSPAATPQAAETQPSESEPAEAENPEIEAPDDSAPATGSDSDLASALDAIMPGLGSADDGPAMEVCGQLSIGSERWLVESVAAGEYAPFVESGFIDGDQATQIVDVVSQYC